MPRTRSTVPTPGTTAPDHPRPQVGLALAAVLVMYLGQMILNPLVAPLSREVGLAEWQVGVMISTAAVMIVLTSQGWGRRSLSWGRKPVLVSTLLLGAVATALFALLARAGMTGLVTGAWLFVLLVVARGVLFGVAISAAAPTAQAYIADVTPTEAERVKGMAGVGAVQGVAMVGGSVVGGLLALGGLMVPLVVVPVLLGLGAAVLAWRLRPETRHELVADPPRVRPADTRVWPWLVAGFGMFTALGFVQVLTGFLVQDRLGLAPSTTATATGGALLAAGIGMVVAQSVVVPRSGWGPGRLLRVGCTVALVGFAALVPDGGAVLLVLAVLLVGLGLGIAMPGYVAGPSLAVSSAEQGAVAGLVGATNALTFVVAPTLATSLYAVRTELPLLAAVAIITLVLAFVLLHPRFRTPRDRGPR